MIMWASLCGVTMIDALWIWNLPVLIVVCGQSMNQRVSGKGSLTFLMAQSPEHVVTVMKEFRTEGWAGLALDKAWDHDDDLTNYY